MNKSNQLTIANTVFSSRLLAGTGKFGSYQVMRDALVAAGSQIVTVALKRIDTRNESDEFLENLRSDNFILLPNTSGARNAREAILAAELAREALQTNWLKLEIHPDPNYLMPDPVETLKAAIELVKLGFVVLPYCHADPVLCKKLEDAGTPVVMPLGSAIGSNAGLQTKYLLEIIISQSNVPVIIDAGIGAPSHAAEAMEMGADAVLVNTAIAIAKDPVALAKAFKMAVEAGRIAFENGTTSFPLNDKLAEASSPLTAFLD